MEGEQRRTVQKGARFKAQRENKARILVRFNLPLGRGKNACREYRCYFEYKRSSIIDRANYIKFSFYRHVLKFLLCEKRIYFDREYSSGYTKATGFLEDLGFHLKTSLPHIRS